MMETKKYVVLNEVFGRYGPECIELYFVEAENEEEVQQKVMEEKLDKEDYDEAFKEYKGNISEMWCALNDVEENFFYIKEIPKKIGGDVQCVTIWEEGKNE